METLDDKGNPIKSDADVRLKQTREESIQFNKNSDTSQPKRPESFSRHQNTFLTFPESVTDCDQPETPRKQRNSTASSSIHEPRTIERTRCRRYGFPAQTSFDATQHLLKSRSDSFLLKPTFGNNDVWKRLPPDFRPQVYAPKPPKRNSRDAVRPWSYGGKSDEWVRVTASTGDMEDCNNQSASDRLAPIDTRYKVPGALEAKLHYVKHGKYPEDQYRMPQPHDFRGYPPIASLGMPDFLTMYERDPYNIHFLSKRLNTIHGLNTEPPLDRWKGKQMGPPLLLPPHWESRLILPRNKWPDRYAAYTRYRVPGRSPHSALMERIEDTLTTKWAQEKMELALQKQANYS